MTWRRHVRRFVRSLGWDIVRYRPLWPTLLGVERLPIRTVLDIGAYDGDTARILRRFFPDAHIYCFEPQPAPVQKLQAWAATQQGQVHVLPFAVGDYNGTAELRTNSRFPRTTSLVWPATGTPATSQADTLAVPIMRLDDAAVAHMMLEDDLLIKIDVEGAERAVLVGGHATLQRCRACIMEFHVQHRFSGQLGLGEAIGLLGEFGLEYGGVLQQQQGRGRLTYYDAIFVNWARGESATPLAVPNPATKEH